MWAFTTGLSAGRRREVDGVPSVMCQVSLVTAADNHSFHHTAREPADKLAGDELNSWIA